MNFVSVSFILFYAVVLLAKFTIGRNSKSESYLYFLIVASLFFYGYHIPEHLGILLISAGVNFWCGACIAAAPSQSQRKRFLFYSVVASLSVLFIFKYFNFFISTLHIQKLLQAIGIHQQGPVLDIILPMGISFFTFQMMSYTIDIYRGILQPVQRFAHFLFYISFFPHLVAGPIVRAKEFLYQIGRSRAFHLRVFTHGGYLIIKGLFLKMVVADNLAFVIRGRWSEAAVTGGDTWVALSAALFFAFQIYCDFEGYSTIARGISYQLGFVLPINFREPYIASSFQDFWRRWHITLSSWLRDYLYVSLGGNRVSHTRTSVNLLIVMLLGGLWHGASFNFVVWGAIHGLALLVERQFYLVKRVTKQSWPVQLIYYTAVQFTVLLAWVFFRATSLQQAVLIIKNIFSFNFGSHDINFWIPYVLIIPPVLIHVRAIGRNKGWWPRENNWVLSIYAAFMIALLLTCYGRSFDFIYLQF